MRNSIFVFTVAKSLFFLPFPLADLYSFPPFLRVLLQADADPHGVDNSNLRWMLDELGVRCSLSLVKQSPTDLESELVLVYIPSFKIDHFQNRPALSAV